MQQRVRQVTAAWPGACGGAGLGFRCRFAWFGWFGSGWISCRDRWLFRAQSLPGQECCGDLQQFHGEIWIATECVGRQQVKGISAAKQKITLYPFTSRSGLTWSCSRLQLRGHFLKCKLYFGRLFPCRGRCGTLVGAGYPPPVISHIGCRGTLSLTGSSNSSSLSSSYLMEATEFILKHKLGCRVPPGHSAGNK